MGELIVGRDSAGGVGVGEGARGTEGGRLEWDEGGGSEEVGGG